MQRAVVLAAGRGTRMRAASARGADEAQRTMAGMGLKPLIPFGGIPFLARVLASLADAGYRQVCLVVRPGDDPLREAVAAAPPTRLHVEFAVQQEPRGTAHALLAAEPFAGHEPFALVNADNLYPVEALRALRDLDGPGLVAFGRQGLLAGNVAPERLAGYALVEAEGGMLRDIVEKPPAEHVEAAGDAALFSMTCWRFDPGIFEACRGIAPSARGEYELPDAVRHAVRHMGARFRVLQLQAPVLDLSSPDDITAVEPFVRGRNSTY
jgi:dTDP-glucose pyrophosphorylase